MITTVIFDMDGLLLDTEPLWGVSMWKVATAHGIPISREYFKETTGLQIHEVTEHWSRRFPWKGSPASEVADAILVDIIARGKAEGRLLPGVASLLQLLKENGFKIGLASSSPLQMITELVGHFGILGQFDVVCSAEEVKYGKPHPAVFLHCAAQLGSEPHQCLVLEDSVNGVIAGKAARMRVVAVPDALHYDDPRFSIADAKFQTLENISLADLALKP